MKINQPILALLICLSIIFVAKKNSFYTGFEEEFGCTEETAMRLLEQEDETDDGVGDTAGTEVRTMDTTLQSMAHINDTAENLEASQKASDLEIEQAASEARKAIEDRAAAAARAAADALAAAAAATRATPSSASNSEPHIERDTAARLAAEAQAATKAAAIAQAAAAVQLAA